MLPMKLSPSKHIIALFLLSAVLSSCAVERRVERPTGCRHGVWVEHRHGRRGHWECEREHRDHVIIVR
jgi:hypothetical protein